jgi:hypothetical protein
MNKVSNHHRVDAHSENTLVVSRGDELVLPLYDERYEELVAMRWARRAGLLGDTQPYVRTRVA